MLNLLTGMDPETSKHLTSTATGRDVLIPASKMVLSPCAARVFIARMKLCRTGSKRGGGNLGNQQIPYQSARSSGT